ncbi:hypothetical protein CsSME_00005855 [Camellia sinensis var. sinensis]
MGFSKSEVERLKQLLNQDPSMGKMIGHAELKDGLYFLQQIWFYVFVYFLVLLLSPNSSWLVPIPLEFAGGC